MAWAAIATLSLTCSPDSETILRNLSFSAKIPPATLIKGGGHLWSLGVEMQFYAAIGFVCLLLGRKGLLIVPVACVLVTAGRIYAAVPISISTMFRVDEILAGGTLALLYAHGCTPRAPVLLGAVLLAASSHQSLEPLMYMRPCAAALLVGLTLVSLPTWAARVLINKPAAYIANISYIVYVFHGILGHTWLESGDKLTINLKRPLLIVLTFLVAHLSTFWFERPVMALVHRSKKTSATAQRPFE